MNQQCPVLRSKSQSTHPDIQKRVPDNKEQRSVSNTFLYKNEESYHFQEANSRLLGARTNKPDNPLLFHHDFGEEKVTAHHDLLIEEEACVQRDDSLNLSLGGRKILEKEEQIIAETLLA